MEEYNYKSEKLEEEFPEYTRNEVIEKVEYKVAGFWIRLIAFLIDMAIVYFVNRIFVTYPLKLINPAAQVSQLFFTNVLFIGITGSIYFILMTKYFRQTLGKMLTGIKVIRRDGREMDWATVVFRELVGRSISQLWGSNLGYLICIFNPRKQTLHDLISDTYVVYEGKVQEKGLVKVELMGKKED